MPHPRLRLASVVAVAVVLAVAGCGRGSDRSSSERSPGGTPLRIVVSTALLGDVVRNVVGDAADVSVLIPEGVDPHEFAPAPRDVAAATEADVVVVGGRGLEEGLDDVVEQARRAGAEVFTATDHIAVRTAPDGSPDPHFWTDPVTMVDVVTALGEALAPHLGSDATSRATAYTEQLADVHRDNATEVSSVPPARRLLVTGHDNLGYWADRYGFGVVGTLIPSTSTGADTNPAHLASIEESVRESGVPVIFVETGTPAGLAHRVATATGAAVVEIPVESLPPERTYLSFIRELTTDITSHLQPSGS